MNDQPATQDEQDDAAFRARLAPLASEVLPPTTGVPRPSRGGGKGSVLALPSEASPLAPAPDPPVVARRGGKRRVLAVAGLTAVALGSAAVWAYFGWPRVGGPPYTELSGRIDAGANGTSGASTGSAGLVSPSVGPPGPVSSSVGPPRSAPSGLSAPGLAPSGGSRQETGLTAVGGGGEKRGAAGVPDLGTAPNATAVSPSPASDIKIAGTRLSGEGRPEMESGRGGALPNIGARPGDSTQDTTTAASRSPASAMTSETEAMVALLSRRGDEALAHGDIVAARLLYERAAAQGSGAAATAAGKTYDVEFLLRVGARGIRADPAAAAAWFRKAAALGDAEGQARLARMEGQARK